MLINETFYLVYTSKEFPALAVAAKQMVSTSVRCLGKELVNTLLKEEDSTKASS
jgi:hypothetical protein